LHALHHKQPEAQQGHQPEAQQGHQPEAQQGHQPEAQQGHQMPEAHSCIKDFFRKRKKTNPHSEHEIFRKGSISPEFTCLFGSTLS